MTGSPRRRVGIPGDLLAARVLTLAPVVAAFPVGIWAVFSAGADRNAVADGIAWAYSLGLFLALASVMWATREVNWYALEARLREGDDAPEPASC